MPRSWAARTIWESYTGWFARTSSADLYASNPAHASADLARLAGSGPTIAEARRQAEIAEAVNDFLNDDLLAAVAPSAEFGRGYDVPMRDCTMMLDNKVIIENGKLVDDRMIVERETRI